MILKPLVAHRQHERDAQVVILAADQEKVGAQGAAPCRQRASWDLCEIGDGIVHPKEIVRDHAPEFGLRAPRISRRPFRIEIDRLGRGHLSDRPSGFRQAD